MSQPIDMTFLEAIFREMLLDIGCSVRLDASDGPIELSAAEVARPDGMLPIFLIAAEVLWTRKTGRPLGVHVIPDQDALLFYRAEAVRHGSLSSVLLALADTLDHRPPGGPVLATTPLDAWATGRAPLQAA